MQLATNLFLWPGPFKDLQGGNRDRYRAGHRQALVEGAYDGGFNLNVAEWGDGLFGIEAAAQHYFHKRAGQLDAARGGVSLRPRCPIRSSATPHIQKPFSAASPPISSRGPQDSRLVEISSPLTWRAFAVAAASALRGRRGAIRHRPWLRYHADARRQSVRLLRSWPGQRRPERLQQRRAKPRHARRLQSMATKRLRGRLFASAAHLRMPPSTVAPTRCAGQCGQASSTADRRTLVISSIVRFRRCRYHFCSRRSMITAASTHCRFSTRDAADGCCTVRRSPRLRRCPTRRRPLPLQPIIAGRRAD